MIKPGKWNAQEVLDRIAALEPGAEPYVEPFRHGTMSLGMYAPGERDDQQPHDQDELYFVHSGTGVFVNAGERTTFQPGDALFVAAGVPHRFEDFSDDFAAWVVFWGERGGEEDG